MSGCGCATSPGGVVKPCSRHVDAASKAPEQLAMVAALLYPALQRLLPDSSLVVTPGQGAPGALWTEDEKVLRQVRGRWVWLQADVDVVVSSSPNFASDTAGLVVRGGADPLEVIIPYSAIPRARAPGPATLTVSWSSLGAYLPAWAAG